jgi:hypothetical protein
VRQAGFEPATRCLEVRFLPGREVHVSRSVAIFVFPDRPLLTAIYRPFWHGCGTRPRSVDCRPKRSEGRWSLGYEQYDERPRRLDSSPMVALTSVDGLRPVSVDLTRLPRLALSRSVSCTNPCTNTVSDLRYLFVWSHGYRRDERVAGHRPRATQPRAST